MSVVPAKNGHTANLGVPARVVRASGAWMAIAVSRSSRFVRGEQDESLVARVRGGEQHAFEAIYDRYSRPLLSFCRHMLGDLQEAEDAVQHTFLSAHRALLADGRDIHLKAWLFAIARNRCLSVLRARRDHLGLEDELEPASTAGLAAEVERREDLREMLDDLARLPDDQREALLLSELRAHSHDEIAEVLGVKRDKVKALVFQAREGLGALRTARLMPCADIREQLATAKGGALRRGPLRRHLETCEGCREFRHEVQRQRAALASILPVIPSFALKQAVLAATIGGGGGAAAAAGVAGGGAVVGAAGVSAAGVGAAGGLKAILGKVLITSAVAAGAGAGVHENRHSDRVPRTLIAETRPETPTSASTPLPVAHRPKAKRAVPAARPAHHRRTIAQHATRHPARRHHHHAATVDDGRDTTVLPGATTQAVASTPPPPPAPAQQQAAVTPS